MNCLNRFEHPGPEEIHGNFAADFSGVRIPDVALCAHCRHWAEPPFSLWESLTLSSQAGGRFSTWLHLWILVKGIAFGPSIFVTYLNKHANWKHALAQASAVSASSRSLVTDLELKLIGEVALGWCSVVLKWNQLGREMRNFTHTCHSDVWTQLVWSMKVRSLSLNTDQLGCCKLKQWVFIQQFIAK